MKSTILARALCCLGIVSGLAALALFSAVAARADSWALLIGIDKYDDADNIAPLGGADNDAAALAKTLTDSCGFPTAHVHVLTSDSARKPARGAILRELEALRQRVQPGDTVFVSFSGHGMESEKIPYLLPSDADISSPSLLRDSSISEEKFRDYLKSIPAKALILVFDMCRVNADRSGRAGVAGDAHMTEAQVRSLDFQSIPKNNSASQSTDRPQIVAEFFASSPNSRSYEWREKNRGYFSWFLEQGLKGAAASNDKGVSLDSLKRYLATSVPQAVRDNEIGKAQVPSGTIIGPLDAGDFVLARTGAHTVPPIPTTKVLLTTLKGSLLAVSSASFSPDGRYILTSSQDGVAKIWDVSTGQIVRILDGHAGGFRSAHFSLDGRYVVTGGSVMDKNARTWNVSTGQLLHTFQGHGDAVWSVTFSPDGRYIATGSFDKTAKIWDASTGQLVRTLEGHTDRIISVCFSPDGQHILTGSRDGTARIWDVSTGQIVRTLIGHRGAVNSASFSPDGRYIVTGGGDDKTAKIWDATTGELLQTLEGHTEGLLSANFSPDGRYIVTSSADKTAKIWDAATGQVIRTLQGHSDYVIYASFSPDGRYIVTSSKDGTAKIWDAATGETGP